MLNLAKIVVNPQMYPRWQAEDVIYMSPLIRLNVGASVGLTTPKRIIKLILLTYLPVSHLSFPDVKVAKDRLNANQPFFMPYFMCIIHLCQMPT